MTDLSRLQRRCLADAYVARNRTGLIRLRKGGTWRDRGPGEHAQAHATRTIHSLVERGLLSLWANRTCAHVTDRGAAVHEALRERERA